MKQKSGDSTYVGNLQELFNFVSSLRKNETNTDISLFSLSCLKKHENVTE
jgi:hypothetical protein